MNCRDLSMDTQRVTGPHVAQPERFAACACASCMVWSRCLKAQFHCEYMLVYFTYEYGLLLSNIEY